MDYPVRRKAYRAQPVALAITLVIHIVFVYLASIQSLPHQQWPVAENAIQYINISPVTEPESPITLPDFNIPSSPANS